MRALLARLATDAEVESAVAAASAYPVFGLYAPVHQLVCSTFIRYKKNNPAYRAYLLDDLSSPRVLSSGADTYALIDSIDYFALDGEIDDEEFKASLSAAAGMRDTAYYNVVFEHLLHPYGFGKNPEGIDRERYNRRIATIMAKVRDGRMGTPSGIDYAGGLLELLGAVQKDTDLFLSVYDPYISDVPKEKLVAFISPLNRRL